MREGWTYKKLGDCLSYIKNGANIKQTKGAVGIPITRIETLSGGAFNRDKLGYADILSADKYSQNILDDGDILMSHINSKTHIGRSVLYKKEKDEQIIHGMNLLRLKVIPSIIGSTFLNAFFQSVSFRNRVAKIRKDAVNQSSMAISDLIKIPIPVPPLLEQKRIVSELDLLSGIIEKKKEQLKAYDQLAQSIFYDMFGDPIVNEKGWEVKKLDAVSTLINGRAYKQDELLNEGKYKVLRVGNFFTNSNYYYSDLELEDNKYCDNGDLLFAWSASFGAFIWSGEKVIYHYHIWKVLFDEQQLNKIFYCYLLNTMTNSFMKDVHGIGMVHLTKQGMEQYDLPLPPLSLQQSFAEKIEAIEKQKSLVQQSIVETQTMFDFTMDKYFG